MGFRLINSIAKMWQIKPPKKKNPQIIERNKIPNKIALSMVNKCSIQQKLNLYNQSLRYINQKIPQSFSKTWDFIKTHLLTHQ